MGTGARTPSTPAGPKPAGSAWDPAQYNRFADERSRPFFDLCALIEPRPSAQVVDLGCGDGRLTSLLHERLDAHSTLGIDSSAPMLEAAASYAGPSLRFEAGDLAAWEGSGYDVVFSNAALHWVPDHADVLARWTSALSPGGQLAVQVPANADHPSHVVARALAEEWFGSNAPADPVEKNVLAVEVYAELLHALGYEHQVARLEVYGHVLDSSADVVEWVKGTSLTRFKARLDPAEYERFLAEYRSRLLDVLGETRPYFYAFKRVLMWGRKGDGASAGRGTR